MDRVLEVFNQQGWYPVPWRHHPPEIRRLIRASRFRPQLKQCYANCQQLIISNQQSGFGLDLHYREGWIETVIPMQHAWLVYNGEILELTLTPNFNHEVQYLNSLECSIDEILVHMLKTGHYGTVRSELELAQIGPYWGLMHAARCRL